DKVAPARVCAVETYGARFARPPESKLSQPNFGGHQSPRLAHVGDRTGLEMIRTLQQKITSLQQEDAQNPDLSEQQLQVFAEPTITDLLTDNVKISGAFGYDRASGDLVLFEAPAVILTTGGM